MAAGRRDMPADSRGPPLYAARPARPGFWRWRRGADDRNDPIERGLGRAAAQAAVPRLASRHARDGPDHGPLRRRARSATLSDAELAEFERLIEVPDRDLLAWITGESAVPRGLRHARCFATARLPPQRRRRRLSMAQSPAELLDAGPPADARERRRRRRRPGRRRSRPRGRGAAERAGDEPAGDLPRRAAHGGARARARVLRARARGAGIPGLGLPALRPRLAARRRGRAAHDRAVAARARSRAATGRRSLLTTVNAALQRVPARDARRDQSLSVAPGNVLDMDGITRWLELNGFARASTVREPGDYAVRGGIIDLYRARHGRAGAARLLRRHAGIDPQLRSRDASAPPTSCARSISCRSPSSSSPPRPSGASASAMSRPSARRRPTICSTRR